MNKIDLIIDALENSEPIGTGWVHVHEQTHQAALAAARELKTINAELLEALKQIDMAGIRYNETPVECVGRLRAIAIDAIKKATGEAE